VSTTLQLVQLRDSPRLYQVDDFVRDDEIEQILALTRDPEDLARRGVVTRQDDAGWSFELPVAGETLLEELRARVHAVVRIESELSPTMRFRRYRPGEHHPSHRDEYEVGGRSLVATAMLCLDAPASGGQTHFPRASPEPIKVSPRKGRLVVWFNHRPDGSVDEAAEHESLPVEAGEKVTLTSFVYAAAERASTRLEPGSLPRVVRPSTDLRFHCIDDDGVPETTTRLLRSACERRGVEYVQVDTREFDYTAAADLGERDLLYRPAVSLSAMRVEQFLHTPRVTSFFRDPMGVFYDCMTQPLVMARAGIPIPRTIYETTTSRPLLRRYVQHLGGFPVVVKWLGRSGGVGVLRVDSFPSLFSLVDYVAEGGSHPLLCQYVPDATHFRLVVIGETVAATYRNAQEPDDFRSYGSDEPADYLVPVDTDMARIAVRVARALGVEMAGVDVLRARTGELYVLEANFPCYFAQAQLAVGVDVAGQMVEHLVRKNRSARGLAEAR
jgi:RimK-like ATP-grasp domain/2OG-Fe(II) oxygenase superfamily